MSRIHLQRLFLFVFPFFSGLASPSSGIAAFFPQIPLRFMVFLSVARSNARVFKEAATCFMLLRLVEFELASIVRFKIATISRAQRFRHGSSSPARRIRPSRLGTCVDESRLGGEEGA